MIRNRLNFELLLYTLALFSALFVRFVRLGAEPLTEFEAGWANQAVALARGQAGEIGPNPGYVALTGVLFAILGASNFLARTWPAVAGALLVFLPVPFRRLLGRPVAIAVAFGLALDPGLVAVSRLAGGSMLALSLGLLALAALYRRRLAVAGLLGGLALLSGVPFLQGALVLGLAWIVGQWLVRSGRLAPLPAISPDSAPLAEREVRLGIGILLGSVLLLGTLFLRSPQSLGALAGAIPAYLAGWVSAPGVPAARLLAALFVYQPLPLIFGVIQLARTFGSRDASPSLGRWVSGWLGLWVLAGLALALLYPGRQVTDLVWLLPPLWGLAAFGIAHLLSVRLEGDLRLVVVAQAVLIFVLTAFMWINLSGMARSLATADPGIVRNFWIIMIGAAVMIVLAASLVLAGWNWSSARLGLVLGVGFALGVYTLSAGFFALRPAPDGSRELWTVGPAAGQAGLLYETLTDLSKQHTGHDKALEVVVLSDLPSLRWLMRDWSGARFATGVQSGDTPAVIIAPEGAEIALSGADYIGQDFAWRIYPDNMPGLPAGPAAWLVYRDGSYQTTQVVLWARADLFPGGLLNAAAPAEEISPSEVLPVENRQPAE